MLKEELAHNFNLRTMRPIPISKLPLKNPDKVHAIMSKLLEEEQSGVGDYSHSTRGWHALGKTKVKINGELMPPRSLWGKRDLSKYHVEDDRIKILDSMKIELYQVVLRTLRGVLNDEMGSEDGDVIYDYIAEIQEQSFSWHKRGPRILEKLIGLKADIAIIEEYDVHFGPRATYSDAPNATFPEAIAAHGYDGLLFDGILKQGEGIGIFWRRDIFEPKINRGSIKNDEGGMATQNDECGKRIGQGTDSIVEVGDYCPDLSNIAYRIKDSRSGKLYEDRWRRNMALIRLVHKETGRELQVSGIHLTGQSGCDARGYTRASELRETFQILAQQPLVATVLAGDFNINSRSTQGEEVLKLVETYEVEDGKRRFHDSGSDPEFILEDAFGDINSGEECSTSYTATRKETIDYIFYTPRRLKPTWRSPLQCPDEPMPNQTEPSDHIAVAVEFTWLSEPECT